MKMNSPLYQLFVNGVPQGTPKDDPEFIKEIADRNQQTEIMWFPMQGIEWAIVNREMYQIACVQHG